MPDPVPGGPPQLRSLLRAEDLLALDLGFVNLSLGTAPGAIPQLTRDQPSQPAFIIIGFPPQHIAEEFAEELSGGLRLLPIPVRALLAGPSRLVFQVPDGVNSIPFTLDSLLSPESWDRLLPRLAPNADPPPTLPRVTLSPADPDIAIDGAPAPYTAIELPYRLILSPGTSESWRHSVNPVTHDGRTELWHTRLVRRAPDTSKPGLRAIWARDFSDSVTRLSTLPSADDRKKIVTGSSDFHQVNSIPALETDRLFLSALGGWLSTQGSWDLPGIDLKGWRHIAGMGRDQYVRVVHDGVLYPFGHRASIIAIGERKFIPLSQPFAGKQAAFLVKKQFIVVREPEKDYSGLTDAYEHKGREFPFTNVRLTTLVTPNLDNLASDGSDVEFWPFVAKRPFFFQLVGVDRSKRDVHFALPLLFTGPNVDPRKEYRSVEPLRRRADLGGQKVAFADSEGNERDNTVLVASAIAFELQEHLPHLPVLDTADVRIPAIDHLLGATGASSASTIKFNHDYLVNDFSDANGHLFADIQQPLPLSAPADKSGGLAAPNMNIQALSRTLGPSPALPEKNPAGDFEWDTAFRGIAGAQLLGGIALSSLIGPGSLENAPKLTLVQSSTSVDATLHLTPSIIALTATASLPINTTLDKTKLTLDSTTISPRDGTPPHHQSTGTLTNFDLEFLETIKVTFDSLTFHAADGQKMEVTAQVADVVFEGELKFVNEIRNILSQFSSGLAIQATSQGVTAGYSLVIPTLSVGVFSLQDLALSTSLFIPFVSAPAQVSFALSKREHPFLVTVSLFGGGGFFSLSARTDGTVAVEAAIEFGGNLELNLVVASGGVHVMAGVYFKLDGANVKIAGYLRCGGHLEVLGLITVSVEFYMALSYDNGTKKVVGEATLTVSVDVTFFSKSVSLHIERRFAGSAADPTFDQSVSRQDWTDYCNAFA